MIIMFPTGFYRDTGQLPKGPTDPTSVTFTISNDIPTRPNDGIPQLPIAEEIRQKSPLVWSAPIRRASYGDLIYSIIQSNRTVTGSNTKYFDLGEYIEFSKEVITPIGQPSIPLKADLQHNTNFLDLPASGLTKEEIASITLQSTTQFTQLESSLASIQAQILTTQSAIGENQKSINEIRKIIAAVQQVLVPIDPILIKLETNEETLVAQRDALTTAYNTLNTQAVQIYNNLLAVSSLVR